MSFRFEYITCRAQAAAHARWQQHEILSGTPESTISDDRLVVDVKIDFSLCGTDLWGDEAF